MATTTSSVDIGTLIYRRPDIHNGRPAIAGTGNSVQNIAILHQQGLSPEEIARNKYLTLAQVYAALTYYFANQAEIEASIEEDIADYDRLEKEWREQRAKERA